MRAGGNDGGSTAADPAEDAHALLNHPWAGRDPGGGRAAGSHSRRRRRPFAQLPLSPRLAGAGEDGVRGDEESGSEGEGAGMESDPVDFSLLAGTERSRGLGCLSQVGIADVTHSA